MNNVINNLDISKTLAGLFSGEIPILSEYSMFNLYAKEPKNQSFAHPPFLIPIFYSYDADHYHIGLVKHWFTDRKMTFGDMIDGISFTTSEIARNEQQFFHKLLFEEFVDSEDCKVTNRMKLCASAFGFDVRVFETYLEINARKKDYGYCNLPIYKKDMPLACVINAQSYTGDFPSNDKALVQKNIHRACFCEISQKPWLGYPPKKKRAFSIFSKESPTQPNIDIPEWLRFDTGKKELFEKYMAQKQNDKAWLTINGPGFTPIEVAHRLQQLKKVSNEKVFHTWVDFWCDKYADHKTFLFI